MSECVSELVSVSVSEWEVYRVHTLERFLPLINQNGNFPCSIESEITL